MDPKMAAFVAIGGAVGAVLRWAGCSLLNQPW